MRPNIGKIITSPRVFDRYFLSGQINPEEEKQAKKGTIFWVIEITAPNQERVANLILNRFRKYYQQKEDGLWGLEAVLKKINRRLAREVQRKNTGWVNHLHAVLGLIQDHSLHLAPSGEVAAYLFRERKISNILEVQETPPPMQTFISVISGEIQLGDKIFLGSSEFTSHITIESLADYLNLPTEKSIAEIANRLRERQIKNVNALLIDYTESDLKVDTIYLDQAPETNLKAAIRNLAFYKDKIFKGISVVAQAIGEFELRYFRKFIEKRQKEEETEKGEIIASALKIEGSQKTSSKFNQRFFNFLKNNQKIIYIIAAILILVTFFSLLIWQRKSSSNKEIVKKLDQAKVLVEEAKNKKVTSQIKEALEKLMEAQALLISAKNYPPLAQEAENLDKTIVQEINTLTNTIQISSLTKTLVDFKSQGDVETSKIFYLDGTLVTFNKKYNQFFSIDLSSPSKIETLFYLPQAAGNPSDATLMKNTNSFFIRNSLDQYYLYNIQDKNLVEAKKSGTFDWPSNPRQLLAYLDRVYFLTAEGLLRSSLTASGFATPDIAASTNDNSQIKSVAIDGAIYFLINGEVKKYILGQEQTDFSLNIPFYIDLSLATKIFTDEDVGSIFIYLKDKQSIVIFDKTGAYSEQLALPSSWGEVQDFIATKDQTLYVLAQNKVYALKY